MPRLPLWSGVGGEQAAAVLGDLRRAGVQRRPVDLHHRAAVRLRAVRRGDLPDLAVDAVLRGGERQRRAPLPGAGLRGQLADALLVVVVGLRHGRVRLVRAGRADALVLVEDPGRRVEQALQAVGPVQRARPPQPVDVEHAAGDVDVALAGDLLLDERHREQRRQVLGADRLMGTRVQRRRRGRRKVGDDVVPLRRHLRLVEHDLRRRGLPGAHEVTVVRVLTRARRGCSMAGPGDGTGYVRCAMESVTVPPVQGADDLTVEWCNAALARTTGGAGRVVDVRTEAVGTGQVADTVRLHLTYEPPGAGPATLVAKVPASEETSRTGARLTGTYEIEASFYRDLAPVLPVRTPYCHHAAHDPVTDAYVVLLEDVAPARQGDQMAGCPVADVAAAIDELVLLHGPRWGDESLTEIALAAPQPAPAGRGHHRPDHLRRRPVQGALHRAPRRRHGGAGRSPRAAARRLPAPATAAVDHRPRRLPGRQPAVRRRAGRRRRLADRRARARACPTSATCSAPASPRPPARRRSPSSSTATSRGSRRTASPSTGTAIWEQYRRYSFGGLIMAIVASALVRRTDRGDEMFVTMAERHARQALDLDAEMLLA